MAGSELAYLKGETVEEGLSKQEYMLLHRECAVCRWPDYRQGRRLELHHIVGGSGRKDLPCGSNWLCLCSRCHRAVHDRIPEYGEIPKGSVLQAKEDADGFVNVKLLASLTGRVSLPYDQCDIPEKFLADRHKRGGLAPWEE